MGRKMFDYVIGNPPYQEDTEGTSDKPVYNIFMNAAFCLAERVELITPARFLFNAGKTPKDWNDERLSDSHKGEKAYNKRAVICDDKEFPTLTSCAKYYDINVSYLCAYLNKRAKMPEKFKKMNLRYKI